MVVNRSTTDLIGELIEDNVIIEMNNDTYGFDVETASITAFQFDRLRVDLENFNAPPIDNELGEMPSGLSGIQVPSLIFDLTFYNEIACPLKLNLNITGEKEVGSDVVVQVSPTIEYNDIAGDTCISRIEISEDSLKVFQISSITAIDTIFSEVDAQALQDPDGNPVSI